MKVAQVVFGLTIAAAATASAEDLVIPYACATDGKAIQVTPSSKNAYRIIGRRDEQPFVVCAKGATACETMMVHRFAIECDGVVVPWSRVAHAAAAHGVAMPANVPEGYAPVSTLSGRFVLPALTRASAHVAPSVSMQDLSADSVIGAAEDYAEARDGNWVTEVRADVLRTVPGSNAGRVAASLAAVFLMLFAASMVAAGRWRFPMFQPAWSTLSASVFGAGFVQLRQRLYAALTSARSSIAEAWQRSATFAPSDDLANAALMLNARLIEVEFSIAALSPHLLLRDVLSSEVETIRGRIGDLEVQMTRRAPQKSAAILRALQRELDRISRIAHSAGHEAPERHAGECHDHIPQSLPEAYRILGINPEAAPAVAKKLVDALRMSWHPDHARDETDRLRREARMKQINAAWDMIKSQRVAA